MKDVRKRVFRNLKCQGKNRAGEPCGKWALNGRNYCSRHGGRTLSGANHPRYVHGRYSKILPKGMDARFVEFLTDPKMLEQREEIALLTARIEQLLSQADNGGSPAGWTELKSEYGRATEFLKQSSVAQSAGNSESAQRVAASFRESFLRIGQIIHAQNHKDSTIKEAFQLLEPRRRLIDSERKRMIETEQMIDVGRVAILVDALADAVRTNVLDPIVLENIGTQFVRILGRSCLGIDSAVREVDLG